jgi:16S rRNA G966 N2-methylase RsmD
VAAKVKAEKELAERAAAIAQVEVALAKAQEELDDAVTEEKVNLAAELELKRQRAATEKQEVRRAAARAASTVLQLPIAQIKVAQIEKEKLALLKEEKALEDADAIRKQVIKKAMAEHLSLYQCHNSTFQQLTVTMKKQHPKCVSPAQLIFVDPPYSSEWWAGSGGLKFADSVDYFLKESGTLAICHK